MKINVKRVYDKPASQDGARVLVDRLWPRGISKAEAKIDEWYKGLAPSNELRTWFHEDTEKRHASFVKKYTAELRSAPREMLSGLARHKTVTLITAVRDIENSHIPVLKAFLKSHI